jgi:hypothetical protein
MSNVIASAETLCPRLKFTQIGKEVKFPGCRHVLGPVWLLTAVVLYSFLWRGWCWYNDRPRSSLSP